MNKQVLTLLIFIQLVFLTTAQKPAEQIRTSRYGRVSIGLDDFQKIVESIEYYFVNTNIDTLERYNKPRISAELVRKDKAISLSSFSQLKELESIDETYTHVHIRYSWDEKGVSEVNLSLNENYRTLSVTGSDVKKVEALFRDLDSQLQSNELILSWIAFDLIILMLLMYAFILSLKYGYLSFERLNRGERDRRTVFIFFSALIIVVLEIIFFFSEVRVKDIFPEVQLTPKNSGFIQRYGDTIGFFLSIITIAGFLMKFTLWGLEIRPKEEKKKRRKEEKIKKELVQLEF